MRRFPVIPFDEQRISGFLRGRGVTAVAPLPGGACNSNYRVELDDGAVVVARFYSRGDPEHDRRILDLAGDAVPVPEMLALGAGWAIMRLLPGQRLGEDSDAIRDAGRTLARIASVQLERSGEILPDGTIRPWPFEETGGFVRTCLAKTEVRRWLGEETVQGVETLMKDEAERLAEIATESRLVHGDFNPTNILVQDSVVSGVLDWEFAHSGTTYMDIGNLQRHLGPERITWVAEGMRDEDWRLPADWQRRAELVDLSSQLEFLTSAKPDTFKAECVARVRALLDTG